MQDFEFADKNEKLPEMLGYELFSPSRADFGTKASERAGRARRTPMSFKCGGI